MIHRMLLVLVLLLPVAVVAKEAVPLAEDPQIEARVMALSANLRCLVCQNQALSASESDFANDVRREIRLMMKEGKSDQQIIDFLVQRYGDFILFKPPVKNITLLLWFGPLLLLLIGATILLLVLRHRNRSTEGSQRLSASEHQRAEALLQGQVTEREMTARDDSDEGHRA